MKRTEIKNRWEELLNPKRFRPETSKQISDRRNPFEDDYSRLLFSSSFRRLQDKTQVFLLDKSDFLRTRLTHLLEVSTIARSIGSSIESYLIDESYLDECFRGHLPALLAAASLVHDLGNPPFGHFGEEAIKSFYKEKLKDNKSIEYNDLVNFDGNVQTFRILTRLSYLKDEFSYNLSYPTLATIVKYPSNSLVGNQPEEKRSSISRKKYGYFFTEEDKFNEINQTLKLNYERHPAVFLMESADDIAYSAADIEDGVKFGALNFNNIYEILKEADTELADKFKEYYNTEYKDSGHSEKDRLNLSIQRIRIDSQSIMIPAVIQRFKEVQGEILTGTYGKELIEDSTASKIRKAFKKMSYIVFDHPVVVEREIASYKIIQGLLNEFYNVADSIDFSKKGEPKSLPKKLYMTISSNYRFIFEKYSTNTDDIFLRYQLINDFISGMTDTYAMKLYQKIKGIRL
ncbi:dGTP triphosphohydrolase [Belliella kenyensis]|uniref:dGTP triphosphohydrolase n=1 Tax=Belliella kenyensis TaxID=1472724 RepID=A0ABV8EK03_9BACT|nr:dNTP triphosphohydrolase [Belliella kenyensis]MCH7402967.1 dNTP triphosphohydrolase [Belliella kenyensis]MDN3605003.1 dNTP triphosphohydrolase [Belliella kenyensis]